MRSGYIRVRAIAADVCGGQGHHQIGLPCGDDITKVTTACVYTRVAVSAVMAMGTSKAMAVVALPFLCSGGEGGVSVSAQRSSRCHG